MLMVSCHHFAKARLHCRGGFRPPYWGRFSPQKTHGFGAVQQKRSGGNLCELS
jgi:hypothetical protein